MPDTVFPYPGGKSQLASWILDWVTEQTCFVEVFGGAAGILVNKDPDMSSVEVYNNRDGDLVHFFADPPFIETRDYYPHSEIDHEVLLQQLNDVEGCALLSLETIPEGHREYWKVTGQDVKRGINLGKSGSAKDARENLLLNFDPEVVEG